ncbi:MAG: hypothetical protein GY755_25415 [Chloroflexi bacterium]|nr:hypothetical protein [Chloroflexota bacterium]
MVTKNDFIHIPYTADLTQGGIAYACRSLPHTYNRMGGSNAKRMRRIVGGIAVELAFRRYLNEQNIPFDVKGATPFTDPDKYDVALGGHRCDVKSFMLSRKKQITDLNRDWGLLLSASALIPSDQFAAANQHESDIYIFSFLTGLQASSQKDMAKAIDAGEPLHLIHTMPKAWANPKGWHSLGELALKSDCDETLTIELGGQDAERKFLSKTITLMPRERVKTEASFHTLAYAHVDKMPSGRVGIHSPQKDETYLIPFTEWKNIWLYGMRVVLAGYLTRAGFRQKAKELPAGSRVYQYKRTRTKNLVVPVADLKPLGELFAQVKSWGKK